jgi:hypothetical protein
VAEQEVHGALTKRLAIAPQCNSLGRIISILVLLVELAAGFRGGRDFPILGDDGRTKSGESQKIARSTYHGLSLRRSQDWGVRQ